jgi:hypothetical protein
MSVLALTDPALDARVLTFGGPARLRPVASLPSEEHDAELTESAEAVTVTVRVGPGDGPRRDRVLHALRELLDAADQGSGSIGDAVAGRPASVHIDPQARTVRRGDEQLTLSRLEFDLLVFLARHPRRVFSRNQLLHQVWGHEHTSARTVDVHVSRLRTKLGAEADPIATVYGVGYRLAEDADVALVR